MLHVQSEFSKGPEHGTRRPDAEAVREGAESSNEFRGNLGHFRSHFEGTKFFCGHLTQPSERSFPLIHDVEEVRDDSRTERLVVPVDVLSLGEREELLVVAETDTDVIAHSEPPDLLVLHLVRRALLRGSKRQHVEFFLRQLHDTTIPGRIPCAPRMWGDGTVLEGDRYSDLEVLAVHDGRGSGKLDEEDWAEGHEYNTHSAHEAPHRYSSGRDGGGGSRLFDPIQDAKDENDAQDAPSQPREVHCLLLVAKPR